MSLYWTPEPLLVGQTVFLLGGGPSLARVDLARLRGRKVIAITGSGHVAPWSDVLYFTDSGFFRQNRSLIEGWAGLVATGSRADLPKRECPRIRWVLTEKRPDFPPMGSPVIRWGRSSGHGAVSLAIAMGAARVVLLGYDMRLLDGRSHHSDRVRSADPKLYELEFLPRFVGWHAAARAVGVDVVNATPGSALLEFPMVDLDVELSRA